MPTYRRKSTGWVARQHHMDERRGPRGERVSYWTGKPLKKSVFLEMM